MTEAHIYDRGYRKYDGVRTGVPGALRTLVSHSAAHALGLRRSAKYKVVPVLIIVSAYLPAAVFIGIAALIPDDDIEEVFLPTYAGYYGYVIAAIYLLAGFITPELLAPDRRTGMLGVYLASPLNRATYLLGKGIAVVLLLLIVTFGPPMLMLIAFSLENSGPDGFVEWMKVFGQIFAGSAAMGVVFASIGLAISASTDRVVVATATILAVLPASAIATDVLVTEAELTPHLRLANLPNLPREIIYRIHGESGLWGTTDNPTWTVYLAGAAWVAVSLSFVWLRYRRLLVRR
jgi:ABC-2 type transport system permease protein